MGFKGINIRQTADRILFRESLKDSSGLAVTSGSTSLRIYELQSDGTLKSYDFNDNTFKTTALTTATASMTQRTGNNGTVDTGVWTYALTTVSGFTSTSIYIYSVNNPNATPPTIEREFQYGSAEGDMTVTSGNIDSNANAISADTTAATRMKNMFTNFLQATVDSGTFSPTTTVFETSVTVDKDVFTDQALYFFSGTNLGFTTGITNYEFSVNSKVKLTVNTLQAAPSNGDGFIVLGKVS